MASIAIIGAGMAGLSAGQALNAAGHSVTIYEKSRGVGGRAATYRHAGYRFDHGAQYLQAPDLGTQALIAVTPDLDGAPASNIEPPVWIFNQDGLISPGDPQQNAAKKWIWPSGINALAKQLAHGQEIRREVTIARIEQLVQPKGSSFTLYDQAGDQVGSADVVLLTAPAPQSAAILRASPMAAALSSPLIEALDRVTYRRCIAVSFAYPQRPDVPWYALVNTDRQHPISWLANEHHKPGHVPDGAALLIAQMADGWSMQHWEALPKGLYGDGAELPEAVVAAHELVQQLTGDIGAPQWAYVQRWRYSLPNGNCSHQQLNTTGSGLYFAGDFLTELGRLHLAMQSGQKTAAQIIADLAR